MKFTNKDEMRAMLRFYWTTCTYASFTITKNEFLKIPWFFFPTRLSDFINAHHIRLSFSYLAFIWLMDGSVNKEIIILPKLLLK